MQMNDRFAMKPTRMRLLVVAAALSAVAMATPVSTAGAATDPPAVATVIGGWDGLQAVALPAPEPVAGQTATVTGPAIITTAPSSFVNTNNQVSAGGNWSGGQAAP
jgi:hypothetical protein